MRTVQLLCRARGALLVPAIAALLCGCPSVPEARAPASDEAANSEPANGEPARPVGSSTPLDQPVAFNSRVEMVHQGTRLRFPPSAAGFGFIGGDRYDREANDVSYAYRRLWRDNRAEVTIYVYPRIFDRDDMTQQEPAEHLEDVVEWIYSKNDDVDEVARSAGATSLRGIPVTYAAAEHEHRGPEGFFFRPVTTGTTVVAAQSWWIKTRFTTAHDHRGEALAAVEELLAALGLPPTGLPPGDGD